MAGIVGIENLAPYCATKFAVKGKFSGNKTNKVKH